MALAHLEHENLIASGLSTIVERLDQVVGNSTWRSTATNVATLKALMDAQAAPTNTAIHETDKAGFQIASRNLDTMVNIGVITDSDIAAMAVNSPVLRIRRRWLRFYGRGATHGSRQFGDNQRVDSQLD